LKDFNFLLLNHYIIYSLNLLLFTLH